MPQCLGWEMQYVLCENSCFIVLHCNDDQPLQLALSLLPSGTLRRLSIPVQYDCDNCIVLLDASLMQLKQRCIYQTSHSTCGYSLKMHQFRHSAVQWNLSATVGSIQNKRLRCIVIYQRKQEINKMTFCKRLSKKHLQYFLNYEP